MCIYIHTHLSQGKNRPVRPWNAPIVLGWKPTATALACGNTVGEPRVPERKNQGWETHLCWMGVTNF